MKASIKFREDQKPLFRAKLPLSILGLPFRSGIVAGESKELTLNLSTFFESGPSIRVGYRPNDTWNPFSLVVKTGTGPFGSAISSSLVMSAEFNLIGGSGNPSFMLHFLPQIGDFNVKKSMSSSAFEKAGGRPLNGGGGGASSDEDGSIEVVDSPAVANGGGFVKRMTVLPPPTASAIAGFFTGVEVTARTKLPVRSSAVVSFRWGVRVPAEIRGGGESVAGINWRKIPFLVMNKIGIEHVDGEDAKSKSQVATNLAVSPGLENADVAEACLTMKGKLEILQAENGMLKKAMDDLRQEIAAGKVAPPAVAGEFKYREIERNGNRNLNGGKSERRNGEKKAAMEGDASEELKKALKGGLN